MLYKNPLGAIQKYLAIGCKKSEAKSELGRTVYTIGT